jgi:hypothetical protein
VKPSTHGVRSTRLAATTPLGAHSGHGQQYGEYATGTVDINGKRYPDSVRTVSYDVSYELGAAASTFEAALALTPTRRGPALRQGPRLVQITVDGIFRVNRFLRDGETVPVRLDVRGRRVVRIISNDSGTRASSRRGSDLLLGTPVVTSQGTQRTRNGGPHTAEQPAAVGGKGTDLVQPGCMALPEVSCSKGQWTSTVRSSAACGAPSATTWAAVTRA